MYDPCACLALCDGSILPVNIEHDICQPILFSLLSAADIDCREHLIIMLCFHLYRRRLKGLRDRYEFYMTWFLAREIKSTLCLTKAVCNIHMQIIFVGLLVAMVIVENAQIKIWIHQTILIWVQRLYLQTASFYINSTAIDVGSISKPLRPIRLCSKENIYSKNHTPEKYVCDRLQSPQARSHISIINGS